MNPIQMSDFAIFMEYVKGCEGWAVFWVAIAIVEIIPKCFKWLAIAIRGHQGVERVYITAEDVEDLDDMDDDELKETVGQLKATNIKLQAQLESLAPKKK